MANINESQKRELKRLFEENGLTKDDVFNHKHYVIIKRSGIEKIQYRNEIKVHFEVVRCEQDWACVKAIGKTDDTEIETFGSATPKNCHNPHYLEMAEKRALSRVVLKLCNLYEHGVFGEDENIDHER